MGSIGNTKEAGREAATNIPSLNAKRSLNAVEASLQDYKNDREKLGLIQLDTENALRTLAIRLEDEDRSGSMWREMQELERLQSKFWSVRNPDEIADAIAYVLDNNGRYLGLENSAELSRIRSRIRNKRYDNARERGGYVLFG